MTNRVLMSTVDMKYFYSLIGSFVLVVAVYLLGVQFNWYGNLEHAGDSVADVYPRNLVGRKEVKPKKTLCPELNKSYLVTLMCNLLLNGRFSMELAHIKWRRPSPNIRCLRLCSICSALDFWVTTDHAEASTPRKWQEIKEAVRQCNAPADEKDPDMVTFLGFEWTQVGTQANDHFGHKNVMFLDIEEGKAPKRPYRSRWSCYGRNEAVIRL